jgi:hypothetical protein
MHVFSGEKKHSTREIFVTGHMLFLMKSTQVGILSEIKTHITKELIIIGYKKKLSSTIDNAVLLVSTLGAVFF